VELKIGDRVKCRLFDVTFIIVGVPDRQIKSDDLYYKVEYIDDDGEVIRIFPPEIDITLDIEYYRDLKLKDILNESRR